MLVEEERPEHEREADVTQTMDRLGKTPASGSLEISVVPGLPGTAHVTVSGEIDLHNAAGLGEAILTTVTSYRTAVTIDLRQVAFCDCAGLNVLLAARHTADRHHRSLRITDASRPVERLLRITGTRPYLT